jgi:hypothetical protein
LRKHTRFPDTKEFTIQVAQRKWEIIVRLKQNVQKVRLQKKEAGLFYKSPASWNKKILLRY